LYFSGDTVWFEGVTEVAKRFAVEIAVLNMGGARKSSRSRSGGSFIEKTFAEAGLRQRLCLLSRWVRTPMLFCA
jgi:hypothetical protein